jgi:DnaD/phage-associated family protein
VNYIKEINAFYDWLETNPMPYSAIVLWHALMQTSNRAGWPCEFAVAISTLSAKTGLKKDAIIRARNRLQQAGRIDFRSRDGNQSAIYTIIPFASELTTQTENNPDCVDLSDTNRAQTALNPRTNRAQSAPINKLNETYSSGGDAREIIDLNFAKAVRAIENQFPGRINPIQADKLSGYISSGMEPELVVRAVEITRLAGKGINYLWGILANCDERGIMTLEDFEADQQRMVSGSSRRSVGPAYYEKKAREAERDEGRDMAIDWPHRPVLSELRREDRSGG